MTTPEPPIRLSAQARQALRESDQALADAARQTEQSIVDALRRRADYDPDAAEDTTRYTGTPRQSGGRR